MPAVRRTRVAALGLVLAHACAVGASCASDAPALRVVVEEKNRLPVRLDALRVDQWLLDFDDTSGAGDPDESGVLLRTTGATATYDGDALEPWAILLARAPDDDGTRSYRVRAAGVRDGDDYVRVEARATIPAGVATVHLRFESACALRRCAMGSTCIEGRCVDERDVACLGEPAARFAWCEPDAASPLDGGRPESGLRCPGATGDCDREAGNSCETDLTSTAAHCGACDHACPVGETCEDGVCACATGGMGRDPATRFSCEDAEGPAGQHCCNGACIDVRTSLESCGACGVECGSGETCEAGRCTCGETRGTSGPACASTESCCAGGGVTGTMGCVDVMSNAGSCGGCSSSCPANETCSNGTCSCGGGPSCGGSCNGFGCGGSGD